MSGIRWIYDGYTRGIGGVYEGLWYDNPVHLDRGRTDRVYPCDP